jgi:hypothetical protein
MTFNDIKEGDIITRYLPGGTPMKLRVSQVEPKHNLIICGPYLFNRSNGYEIDDDAGWGPGETGSYIKPE